MSELPIVAVTVHRDGAIVERAGEVAVVDGIARVHKLPLLLDERSLRARVDGCALGGVRLELDVEGADRGVAPELETAWLEAARRVRQIEAELRAVEEERALIAAVEPSGPVGDEDPPGPEQLRAWAALEPELDAWAAALDERIGPLRHSLGLAREQESIARSRHEAQGSEAHWQFWAPMRRAVLQLRDGPPDRVTVTLSYRIEGACWTPSYALHADAALRRGRFTISALVAQATGESWRGVRLAVATAPCLRTVDLPELPALRLGRQQAAGRPAWRELPPGLDALFPGELTGPVDRAAAEQVRVARESRRKRLVEDAPAPAAAPLPAPSMLLAAPRSAPGLASRAIAAVAGAADTVGRAAAPAPAPQSAAPVDRGGPLEVDPDTLDYPHLRLADVEAPADRRGRLWPVGVQEEALEAGLPAVAADRLAAARQSAAAFVESLRHRQLPTDHVLPGPIDGADFRFEAGDAVDISSDGRFQRVALRSDEVELHVRYRAVPRLDPRAFRTVRAVLPSAAPLLPGPVDVHVDGALVLTAPWKGSPRGGVLDIGLGAEDGLRVARNVRYREETAGLMGGYRRTHTEVEIEIASGLSREAAIEVLERVPVTTDPEVTIEIVGADPASEPFTGDEGDPVLEGGQRQRLTLAPGGQAKASLRYVVTTSAKLELTGGDRRG